MEWLVRSGNTEDIEAFFAESISRMESRYHIAKGKIRDFSTERKTKEFQENAKKNTLTPMIEN